MNLFKITVIVFLFISEILYAQRSKNSFPVLPDSSKIRLKLEGTILPNKEFQHLKIIVPSRKSRNNIFLIPNLDLNSDLTLTLNSFAQKDKLASAKNNISKFLMLKYNSIPNYDLGKFGVYLGISKKVFAIILGIISLL